ncbi:MAG: amidohydrolase, partial [Lutimonas sp.]
MKQILLTIAFLSLLNLIQGQSLNSAKMDQEILKIESKVIEWRHDLHQNPELGNREFRTSEIIAKHLTSLGIDVKTEVAKTGVVGVLKGGKPGPVIA